MQRTLSTDVSDPGDLLGPLLEEETLSMEVCPNARKIISRWLVSLVSSYREMFARVFFMSSTILQSKAGRLAEFSGGKMCVYIVRWSVWSVLLMDVYFVVVVFSNLLYVFCVEDVSGSTFLSIYLNFSFSISITVGAPWLLRLYQPFCFGGSFSVVVFFLVVFRHRYVLTVCLELGASSDAASSSSSSSSSWTFSLPSKWSFILEAMESVTQFQSRKVFSECHAWCNSKKLSFTIRFVWNTTFELCADLVRRLFLLPNVTFLLHAKWKVCYSLLSQLFVAWVLLLQMSRTWGDE